MPEKVKKFYSLGTGVRGDALEKEINEWLATMGEKIEITQRVMHSSSTFGDVQVVVLLFYKDRY